MTPGVTTCYLECFPWKVAVCYELLMYVPVFHYTKGETATAKLQVTEHAKGKQFLV